MRHYRQKHFFHASASFEILGFLALHNVFQFSCFTFQASGKKTSKTHCSVFLLYDFLDLCL